FVAGLALGDALSATVPDARVAVGVDGAERGRSRFALKWPNDLLADGAKLAGILLESTSLEGGRLALAAGIGVNVASHPEDVPYPATSLASLGAKPDAGMLFLALSDAWIDNVRLWDGGRGLAAVRERWLERAAGLGGEVSVRVDGRVVRGIFETIDELCRFVIREDDGTRLRIAAGDVHFGAVASVRA
ncbi:biotin--[acetyl-CoA-carboxylase] ligase, partial [Nitratireductor sp. GCM10026969]|uniref:biotin--[acetyl-CoA-carboxylase] ligase n=1 Tax=Nitratireductor sp. GCM10026969 TaxID=3252645 RepID=UPI003614A18B